MRKSGAPSIRKIVHIPSPVTTIVSNPNIIITSNSLDLNLSCKMDVNKSILASSKRSTTSILNLLAKPSNIEASVISNSQENNNPHHENKQLANQSVTSISKNKIFKVVWGKKTTKKHKTWEGDGTLELGEKSAILRDDEGQVLGRATNMRSSALEEGSIISVGSKEVQLIELVPFNAAVLTPANKIHECTPDEQPPPYKKPKKSKSGPTLNIFNVNNSSVRKQKIPHINMTDYEPLVMPPPSPDHQWNSNVSKRPLTAVSVDPCLARALRPHQREGIVFLYECVMGFRHNIVLENGPGNQEIYTGAILADEMGLGKTLQCITLLWTLLKQGPYGSPVIRRIIVIAPSSLCSNWQNEFKMWLGQERIQTFVVDAKNKPLDYAKMPHIPVMIISYEMAVRYIGDIQSIKFDLLICDEGHRLKNQSNKVSNAIHQLDCKRRIVLTGTPIQNDLQEFYSIFDFVNPGMLGSVSEYKSYFENVIVQSQQPECSPDDKSLGEKRAKELNERTFNFILRRTQEVNNKYLPTKQEVVIFCKMSDLQKYLYTSVLKYYESRNEYCNSDVAHLQVITCLKKICNHPSLLQKISDGSNQTEGGLYDYLLSLLPAWNEMGEDDSGKLKVVQCLLESLKVSKERIVLVSYYTQTLDMLAGVCDHYGYKYCRLDGTTPSCDRGKIVDQFNNQFSGLFVFLLSAKAGGVGLNITGASRLVLYDTDWNPATDLQAMSRIWRDGQKKPVIIYRLLTTGSIEEKMYQRQMSKTSLSGTVVDTNSTSFNQLKLSQVELKDLFTLSEELTTHDILKCDCKGNGDIPESRVDPKQNKSLEDRECQLTLTQSGFQSNSANNSSLRMHQLQFWEHHKQPIADAVLNAIDLADASEDIVFMFRNQHVTSKT